MSTPVPAARHGVLASVLVVIFAVASALVFVAIYLALPSTDGHFFALLTIGILALVLAGVAYFAQAFSTDATAQRALSWGYLGMGFALLILTIAINPFGVLGVIAQLVILALLVVLAGIVAAGVWWRSSGRRSEAYRAAERAKWSSRPAPSAFSYSAAQGVTAPTEPAHEPPRPGSP